MTQVLEKGPRASTKNIWFERELLAASSSTNLEEAAQEWLWLKKEWEKEKKHCHLCHTQLLQFVAIHNKVNGNVLLIGLDCYSKLLQFLALNVVQSVSLPTVRQYIKESRQYVKSNINESMLTWLEAYTETPDDVRVIVEHIRRFKYTSSIPDGEKLVQYYMSTRRFSVRELLSFTEYSLFLELPDSSNIPQEITLTQFNELRVTLERISREKHLVESARRYAVRGAKDYITTLLKRSYLSYDEEQVLREKAKNIDLEIAQETPEKVVALFKSMVVFSRDFIFSLFTYSSMKWLRNKYLGNITTLFSDEVSLTSLEAVNGELQGKAEALRSCCEGLIKVSIVKKVFGNQRHAFYIKSPKIGYIRFDVETQFLTNWKGVAKKREHPLDHYRPYVFEKSSADDLYLNRKASDELLSGYLWMDALVASVPSFVHCHVRDGIGIVLDADDRDQWIDRAFEKLEIEVAECREECREEIMRMRREDQEEDKRREDKEIEMVLHAKEQATVWIDSTCALPNPKVRALVFSLGVNHKTGDSQLEARSGKYKYVLIDNGSESGVVPGNRTYCIIAKELVPDHVYLVAPLTWCEDTTKSVISQKPLDGMGWQCKALYRNGRSVVPGWYLNSSRMNELLPFKK